MEKVARTVLMVVVAILVLSMIVGVIVVGLSVLFPLLLAGLILYGVFYIYQRSSFLQKLFGGSKSKKGKHASSVTTYYELDEYGNRKNSETIVEVYEEDKK